MTKEIKIAPSILSADFSKLGDEISVLDKTDCEYIHIDVMDGHFVPNLTIGPNVVKSIRNLSKKIFDVHLMIDPVEKFLDDFANAGADIITIHHEISENVFKCLEKIKNKKIKAGISLKPSTPGDVIKKYINHIDLVLIMTVEPGFGGQTFMYNQLNKIQEVRKIVANRDIEIEVDGGITLETAKKVKDAGADVIVSGSTIFKNKDYGKIISKLRVA